MKTTIILFLTALMCLIGVSAQADGSVMIDDDLIGTLIEILSARAHPVGFGNINGNGSGKLAVKDHSVFPECRSDLSIGGNIEKKSGNAKKTHVLREFLGHCDIRLNTDPSECLAKSAGRTHAVAVNTLVKEDKADTVLLFEFGSHIYKLLRYAF